MGEGLEVRYSLCCRKQGCRHRVTPPSLRFMGRKVHAAWRVVMIEEFRDLLGHQPELARQTLARWRNYWRDTLQEGSLFMRWARGSGGLAASVGDSPSLSTILRSFGFPSPGSWIPSLRFFTRFTG